MEAGKRTEAPAVTHPPGMGRFGQEPTSRSSFWLPSMCQSARIGRDRGAGAGRGRRTQPMGIAFLPRRRVMQQHRRAKPGIRLQHGWIKAFFWVLWNKESSQGIVLSFILLSRGSRGRTGCPRVRSHCRQRLSSCCLVHGRLSISPGASTLFSLHFSCKWRERDLDQAANDRHSSVGQSSSIPTGLTRSSVCPWYLTRNTQTFSPFLILLSFALGYGSLGCTHLQM